MNVFVLGTGRCGSTTFFHACRHVTNFTVSHEGRAKKLTHRLEYPDGHIEVDPWLVDHLGGLGRRYPEALYVHLTRPEDEIVESLLKRWEHSAWLRYLQSVYRPVTEGERRQVCQSCVRRMMENLEAFFETLAPERRMTVRLHHVKTDFSQFLVWIGAEGDLTAALAEWDYQYNRSKG